MRAPVKPSPQYQGKGLIRRLQKFPVSLLTGVKTLHLRSTLYQFEVSNTVLLTGGAVQYVSSVELILVSN